MDELRGVLARIDAALAADIPVRSVAEARECAALRQRMRTLRLHLIKFLPPTNERNT